MTMSKRLELWLCVMFVCSIWAGRSLAQDSWELVVKNSGTIAMQVQLMHTNRVVMYDRTDYGASQLTFPDGYCRMNPRDIRLKKDCTAHSNVLDLATTKITPLKIFSNPWCSSGAVLADGTLLSTGGWNDGAAVIRTIGAKAGNDWKEFLKPAEGLLSARWYASDQILPDNRVIVVGGRRAFSYEFVPRKQGEGQYQLPFLKATTTPGAENNLYPFLFLNPDGNLFIMANQDAILLNYKVNRVVRTYPKIPGGPRNYPSSAGMVALPLSAEDGYKRVEVMVCGGCTPTAFLNVGKGIFETALSSCGRMVITDANAQWRMVNMPSPRVMGDMLNLPNGEVIIINGAKRGTAGWTSALLPALQPVTYDPTKNRFFTWKASTIPRMYHSSAVVLPDGKILVAGSNPHIGYDFKPKNYPYPTELRIEKYSPFYLHKSYNLRRPTILASTAFVPHNADFQVTFTLLQKPVALLFRLYAPPFTTHGYSMNQRMLVLKLKAVRTLAQNRYTATVVAPPNSVICPTGYYLLTCQNQGTPSRSVWVKIG
ncbi:hypothetical protein M758_8G046100 [Ceratodon purpureus]|nr:hypothetical protein M758_8G046100 [Ceratodon purpureus]